MPEKGICKILKKILKLLCLTVILCLMLTGYARYIEPDLLRIKSLKIDTAKDIRPCKVVFFTDTHFGKYYDVSHVETIVKKINQTNADVVVFGGDLLDNFARDREDIDLEYLKNQLGKIEAKAGKYAVWGNHDYGGGAVRIYEELLTSCGFQVLDDESLVLEDYGIKLIGYDDYLMGWTDPSLYTIKSELFNIIVAHEPIISQFIENKSDNFLLSGHTHGGQVNIPFLTAKLLPKGSGQFVKGFYTKEEIGTAVSLNMYTSSGVGMTRYPFRFLNVPEIVEITFN